MLTVMVRQLADGREILFEAKTVEYLRSGNDAGLRINLQDDTSTHLSHSTNENDRRDAFVMNSNGKTVARYDL